MSAHTLGKREKLCLIVSRGLAAAVLYRQNESKAIFMGEVLASEECWPLKYLTWGVSGCATN